MNDEEPVIVWPPSFRAKNENTSEFSKSTLQHTPSPLASNNSAASSFSSHQKQLLSLVENPDFPSKNGTGPKSPIYSDRFIPLKRVTESFYPDNDGYPSYPDKVLFTDNSHYNANYHNMLCNAYMLSPEINQLYRYSCFSPQEVHNHPLYANNSKLKFLSFRKSRRSGIFSETDTDKPWTHLSTERAPEIDLQEKNLPIKAPYKIIKTPCLNDDFYLNLLHWSSNNNVAVALGENVYLWSTATGKASNFTAKSPNILCAREEVSSSPKNDSTYTAVQFSPSSQQIALGTSQGMLEIWDFSQRKRVLDLKRHAGRISSVSWRNSNVIACGSKDKTISIIDLRASTTQNIKVEKILLHKQEICGLTWSEDGEYLASGGNDNKVFVHSARNFSNPTLRITKHSAAVKALAWSPHRRDIICTGGGNNDKMIRVWSLAENKEVTSINSGSQVCNLSFGPDSNPWEIVVSNGFPSNDLVVWDLNKGKKRQIFQGHSSRVVFMSKNAEGSKFVTAAGDELMKFWNVFGSSSADEKSHLSINKLDLR